MSKSDAIGTLLKSRRAGYVANFRLDESTNTVVLEIPIDLVKGRAGKGFTSQRQLAHLRRVLGEQLNLNVITTYRQTQQYVDLEAGLRAILARKFPLYVEDIYMSYPTGESAQIWVTLKHDVEEGTSYDIENQVNDFLRDAALKLEALNFIKPHLQVPSIVAILRAVKTLSPAKLPQIAKYLSEREFLVPDEGWLSRKLDVARKKGFAAREAHGVYILTATGLEIVPHSRSKTSSDIERMLLLSRRKEW